MQAPWTSAHAGLIAAAAMLEDGGLERMRDERYAGWDTEDAQALLTNATLEHCEECVRGGPINPSPVSGRQERLENWISRFV
jgi:xylose isomerase